MIETSGTGGGDRLDRIEENMLAIQDAVLALTQISQDNTLAIQQLITDANTDRQTFQAEILRIWEYLLSQNPNGRGRTGD